MSQFPFEIIHCDIWGPHHVPSYNGCRYFLKLVDNYSRFTWLLLLKHKSDLLTIIPRFFAMALTQFNFRIKMLRSDNAPELKLDELCAECGVLY